MSMLLKELLKNLGARKKEQTSLVLFVHLNSIESQLAVCTTQQMA